MTIEHLRAAGVSLVVSEGGPSGLLRVLHWGADLGELSAEDLNALARSRDAVDAVASSGPVVAAVFAQAAGGSLARPGLLGDRGGADASPLFAPRGMERRPGDGGVGDAILLRAKDVDSALDLEVELELTAEGLARVRARVRNAHPSERYSIHSLDLGLPVPVAATELLDFGGRHGLERVPGRTPFPDGARFREARGGRPGHDAAFLTVAGSDGFGFAQGEVWAAHVAWSGNQRTFTERLGESGRRIGGGELLWPGEVVLRPGEDYVSPWLFGSYSGDGLDAMSHRFHRRLRTDRARPLAAKTTVNSWEAVYFDLSEGGLIELAERAESIGAERFVVDDGWFGRRHDDTSSLGDWTIDPERWPRGLHAVADRVRQLGLDFGLWFEPEMISPDSDLARAHPDWVLGTPGREGITVRHQSTLDLSRDDVYAHVRDAVAAVVREYRLDYIKWDYNRRMIDPTGADGRVNARGQVLALYRLTDELLAEFPDLVIEACSSGGARIDLELGRRVGRFWPSDNTDPVDRAEIQEWTSLLVPPEMIGAHIPRPAPPMTGRASDLGFRAVVALFGDLGVEWDLAAVSPAELEELRAWIRLAQQHRSLLSSGWTVRGSHPDPAVRVHGVVADDETEGLFAVEATASTRETTIGAVRLPGLRPQTRYHVAEITPVRPSTHFRDPGWMAEGLQLPGSALQSVGVDLGVLYPQQARLIHLRSV